MGNSGGQLGSGSTADEAMASALAAGANLNGKIAIVTGGNTGLSFVLATAQNALLSALPGIGLETARVLAVNNCRVIIGTIRFLSKFDLFSGAVVFGCFGNGLADDYFISMQKPEESN